MFDDGDQLRIYSVELRIAEPSESNLPLLSLLGRNVINRWYMQYDPEDPACSRLLSLPYSMNTRLECVVRNADFSLEPQ